MEQGTVVEKEYKKDYEPGSGSLHIPVLGDLFPKLFSQEMRASGRWFVIVRIEGLYRYEITEELYEIIQIGDKIEIGIDKYGMPDVKLLHK